VAVSEGQAEVSVMSDFGELIETLWRPEIARLRIPSLGRAEAELLGVIAAAAGARRALEVGTAIGYSAAYLAAGMGPDGHVVGIELDPARAAAARRLWAVTGLDERAEVREGDALRLVPTLGTGFDLVFVDVLWELGEAERGRELARGVVAALRPGGAVVADNCGQGIPAADGFVAELTAGACRASTLVPIRDGLFIAVLG
jgi:predicted O-methyltransferase YrrM